MELRIEKLKNKTETFYSIFETGQFAKPIIILTERELQRFEQRIKNTKSDKK